MRKLILGFVLATSCSPDTQWSEPKTELNFSEEVIYGQDNRLDFYQVTNPEVRELALSTVALIQSSKLTNQANGQTLIQGTAFSATRNLCTTERFREQPTSAFCSGSLVSPQLILTAGHCVRTQDDCLRTRFVFGYSVVQEGVMPKQVPTSEVYSCRQIIHTQASSVDFAVIELDRPVTNHPYIRVRRSGVIPNSESVFVIGHPSGLPLKVAGGARVRDNSPQGYFVANLDTYGGNSGSAVFNTNTGLIEGVLVRGEQDFKTQNGCSVSFVCTDGSCRGEDVTKVSEALRFLPTEQPQPSPSISPTPAPRPSPSPWPTPAGVEVFTSSPNKTIPDNDKTGINSAINVNSAPAGRKVEVTLNITHTWIGDLVVRVQAPNGAIYSLHQRSGGSSDNIVGTYPTTLKPNQALTLLSDVTTPGVWKLLVSDEARIDVGTLNSWALTFR